MARVVITLLAGLLLWPSAYACEAPTVHVVVPYPAGGSLDGVVRVVADAASRASGRTFVVQNVGGASGTIGAKHVLRQPKDGCTVFAGSLNSLVLAPSQQPDVTYVAADFRPVGLIGDTGLMVLASSNLGANSLADLPSVSSRLGRPLNAGHPGTESAQYLALPIVAERLDLSLVHVPYKGSAPMLKDLAGGHIDIAVVAAPAGRAALEHGRVALLAHLSEWMRSEAGGRQEPLETWAGWFVPKAVADDRVDWLRSAFTRALNMSETAKLLEAMGSPIPSHAAQDAFARRIARDAERFRPASVHSNSVRVR